MKKNNLFVLFAFILLASNTACGRNYAGRYSGTMSTTVNGAAQSSPVTVTFNDNSGNGSVTGSIAGQYGSGSINGGVPAGDVINNVTVALATTASAYPQVGTVGVPTAYPTAGYPTAGVTPGMSQSCNYTGSITVANNQLNATLNSAQTGAVGVTPGYSMCGPLTITATKQ